jgi:hypothetical protein
LASRPGVDRAPAHDLVKFQVNQQLFGTLFANLRL